MIAASYDSNGGYQAAEGYQVLLPLNWPVQRGQKPPVIVHHGINSGALQIIPGFGGRLFWELCRAGYPVITFDQGGPTTFGNDTAIARARQAQTYMQDTIGAKSGPAFHLGFSMGGIAAMNLAREFPAEVQAIAGGMPGVDLAYLHDVSHTAQIETAYGDLAAYEAALPTHNPMAYAEAGLDGISVHFWLGDQDTVVNYARQQAFLALRPVTGSTVLAGATHTGVEAIPAFAIPAFFDTNL